MSEKWEFSIMQSTQEPLGEGEGEGTALSDEEGDPERLAKPDGDWEGLLVADAEPLMDWVKGAESEAEAEAEAEGLAESCWRRNF